MGKTVNESILDCTNACKVTMDSIAKELTKGASQSSLRGFEQGALSGSYSTHVGVGFVGDKERDVTDPVFHAIFHRELDAGSAGGDGLYTIANPDSDHYHKDFIPNKVGRYLGSIYEFIDYLERAALNCEKGKKQFKVRDHKRRMEDLANSFDLTQIKEDPELQDMYATMTPFLRLYFIGYNWLMADFLSQELRILGAWESSVLKVIGFLTRNDMSPQGFFKEKSEKLKVMFEREFKTFDIEPKSGVKQYYAWKSLLDGYEGAIKEFNVEANEFDSVKAIRAAIDKWALCLPAQKVKPTPPPRKSSLFAGGSAPKSHTTQSAASPPMNVMSLLRFIREHGQGPQSGNTHGK